MREREREREKEREREREGGVWWKERVALSLKITASALKFAVPRTLHFLCCGPSFQFAGPRSYNEKSPPFPFAGPRC